jgi:hypothetical protein
VGNPIWQKLHAQVLGEGRHTLALQQLRPWQPTEVAGRFKVDIVTVRKAELGLAPQQRPGRAA